MLQGELTGSSLVFEVSSSHPAGTGSISGSVFIPQVNVQLNFSAIKDNTLNPEPEFDGETIRSETFDNGDYVEVRYKEPIIHMKEFNSFYEKENFEFEVFKVDGDDNEILTPLKMNKKFSAIVNDLLLDEEETGLGQPSDARLFEDDTDSSDFMEYFFSIEVDKEIPEEILCKAIDSLEVNSQFLDEELICPDQRTDRFDIYATRVGPDDLEDCD